MSSLFTHFFRKKRHSQFNNPSAKSIETILSSEPSEPKLCKTERFTNSCTSSCTNCYEISPIEFMAKPMAGSINTSSVFNTPVKKATFLQGFYGVFEEHISDHIGDLLNLPENTAASTDPSSLSTEDFSGYMEKVTTSYSQFMRERENTQESSIQGQIDVTGSLMKCYKKVPQQYFDPKFHFNFCMMSTEQDGLAKFQTGLGESIKLVEENLYYQISTKRGMILMAIRDLTDQEMRISRCIEAIAGIKSNNTRLNEANISKIKEVLKLKRKQMNMQKTVQTLEMMNLLKKIVPTLEQLIQRGNFDYAVSLLNSSEQTCTQRLGSIRCLQVFQANFQQARTALQQLLAGEFEKRCLDYLSKCLNYRKDKYDQISNNLAAQEQSPVDIMVSKKDGKSLQVSVERYEFNWTLEESSADSNTLDQISKIILAHIKLKEVSLTSYRLKLNEILRKFHKQIVGDMNEQVILITSKSSMNQESTTAVVFEQRVKFMVFYFRTFKQFLLKFSDINTQVISKIISYFDQKMFSEDSTHNDKPHENDASSLKVLTETVQEFYSLYTVVIRNFIDKMAQIIQLVDLNNATISQFLLFEEGLDEVLVFIREKFDIQGRLTSTINTKNETLKKALTKTISGFLDQISISPLTSLRLITEKQFIQAYYTNKKDELIKKMKQEKWQAIDVLPDHLDHFKILYDTSIETPESLSATRFASTSTEASEASSAKIRTFRDEGSLSPETILDQKCQLKESDTTVVDSMVSIKKKAISISGTSYKVTDSLIEMVQTVSELYLLSLKFGSISEESILKIFQLTKLFGSTVEYDVLKGNAFSGTKGGIITPEILSLAAVSLLLVGRGMEVLTSKVRRSCTSTFNIIENEANQTRSSIDDLAGRFLSKISEILRDVVIVDNCSKLKKVRWTNSQEKLSAPSSFSSQMLSKIKAVHKKIKNYLPHEDLNTVFRFVMDDLTKHYLGVFEELEVETGTTARRVKDELTCFMEEMKKTDIFGDFELDLYEFEEKARIITEHKCDPFIELASIIDGQEGEAAE